MHDFFINILIYSINVCHVVTKNMFFLAAASTLAKTVYFLRDFVFVVTTKLR